MRSILLALALIAPSTAFAATSPATSPEDRTSPITSIHTVKPQQILVTIQNNAVQDRILKIGDRMYSLRPAQIVTAPAPVGSSILMYSNQNSKINGLELLKVSATDNRQVITMH